MRQPPSVDEHFADLMDGDGAVDVRDAVVVDLIRTYLDDVRSFLADLHQTGGSGRQVNELHSDLTDRLVRRLFWLAEESFFGGGGEAQSELAVIAVGGSARREMSIHSDVDLLFLHRDTVDPFVQTVTERLQYWMWDASLPIGSATRTIGETISLAKEDPSVATAILNPRLLAGSGILFHEFARRRTGELLADPERFIGGLIESARERHASYGDSLYLLQPNIKEGQGTLRDYHTAFWATQALQPSARRVEEFLYLGLLTENELFALREALEFLWRIRNELHLETGRKTDQLSFEIQEQMASSLGYADLAGEELPVERFMQDFYRHARVIDNQSQLVIEQCYARVRKVRRRRRVKDVEGGFRIREGLLEIPHGRQLREEPLGILNAYAVAQNHDVSLTRKARRLIRANLGEIDDAYRSDARAVAIFERILNARNRVMRTLMLMNEDGVLGRFLPEWEHIVCRWQHVMYHTYTVDVHTIFLVEELRRLFKGEYEEFVPDLTELMRGADDLVVLFLGCMLHDIGKGFGGDHSNKGAARARRCVERLGLAPQRVDRIVFLVEHHLLMSHLAQSRDLSDPRMILDFARTVENRTNLRDLYLLTFADIRASSKTAWSHWKGQLLQELFERTSEFLETGSDDKSRAIELIESRVETRRNAARAELLNQGIGELEIQDYFDMMPRRYFIAHAPRQIARHARVVLEFDPEKILSTAVREMRGGFSEFIVCTRDLHGLYSKVAGVLTAFHVNILGAHVYTARSGLALEIYRVSTPDGGESERALTWSEIREALSSVFTGAVDVEELVRRRGRRVGKRARPKARNPVVVAVTNDESDFYTIADITANDRIGLLHALTSVIAKLGYEIYISKAATVLDQVQDTFYLKDPHGKKILDADAVAELEAALHSVAVGDVRGEDA